MVMSVWVAITVVGLFYGGRKLWGYMELSEEFSSHEVKVARVILATAALANVVLCIYSGFWIGMWLAGALLFGACPLNRGAKREL